MHPRTIRALVLDPIYEGETEWLVWKISGTVRIPFGQITSTRTSVARSS